MLSTALPPGALVSVTQHHRFDDQQYHRDVAFYLDGDSEDDLSVYVMVNTWWGPVDFTVQQAPGTGWRRLLDTSLPSPNDIAEPGQETALPGDTYTVQPRSIVVLLG